MRCGLNGAWCASNALFTCCAVCDPQARSREHLKCVAAHILSLGHSGLTHAGPLDQRQPAVDSAAQYLLGQLGLSCQQSMQ
jgi:hypothetical protein